jgi:hypothetical protein
MPRLIATKRRQKKPILLTADYADEIPGRSHAVILSRAKDPRSRRMFVLPLGSFARLRMTHRKVSDYFWVFLVFCGYPNPRYLAMRAADSAGEACSVSMTRSVRGMTGVAKTPAARN